MSGVSSVSSNYPADASPSSGSDQQAAAEAAQQAAQQQAQAAEAAAQTAATTVFTATVPQGVNASA